MPGDDDPRKERRLATDRRRREPGKPGLSDRKVTPERREQLFKWFAACEAAEAAGEPPPPMPAETQPDGFQEQVNGRWIEWRNGKRVPLVPWTPDSTGYDKEREHTSKILAEDLKRFNEGIPFAPPEPDQPAEGEVRSLNGREIEWRNAQWLDLVTGEPANMEASAFAQETEVILAEMKARLAAKKERLDEMKTQLAELKAQVEEDAPDDEDEDEDD